MQPQITSFLNKPHSGLDFAHWLQKGKSSKSANHTTNLSKVRAYASRKRKLLSAATSNKLKKVVLSDGSICYTMTSCPNPLYEPVPKKKRRCDQAKAPPHVLPAAFSAKNASKPGLFYSRSMPMLVQRPIATPLRKRRHSIHADWTSQDNLLASLEQQESISDKIFPSHVPEVDLEEMFNGKQFIKVHKKIRPINSRRETCIHLQKQLY